VKKIRSLLVEENKEKKIKSKYEEIYSDSDTWLYKKSHGVHSVVLSQIKQKLMGKRCLDIGCGAGRLPIMCAHFAEKVTAFDFSKKAIDLAGLNASCVELDNIEFQVSGIEEFCRAAQAGVYDVITMIGVLEHVEDVLGTLQRIRGLLCDQGILIVSCPNFINFRGFTYMTLLTLFNLPMSLADLRQVDYKDMADWATKSGFNVIKTVGAIYRFAWEEKACRDMARRVPLAIKDKGIPFDVDYDKYNSWLNRMVGFNSKYLQWLEDGGILKRIEKQVEINIKRTVTVDDALWQKMLRYLQEDITSDPYYSDVPPFCYMGGEGIYILEKWLKEP